MSKTKQQSDLKAATKQPKAKKCCKVKRVRCTVDSKA